eukprot:scaffold11219_cov66-Phaeocystis_antarctica.AAC.2
MRTAGACSTFERCTREVAGIESRLGWHLVHSRPRVCGIRESKLCTRVRVHGLRASHRPVCFRAEHPRAQLHLAVRVVRVVQPMSLVSAATIDAAIGIVDAIDSLNVVAAIHVVRRVQAACRLGCSYGVDPGAGACGSPSACGAGGLQADAVALVHPTRVVASRLRGGRAQKRADDEEKGRCRHLIEPVRSSRTTEEVSFWCRSI